MPFADTSFDYLFENELRWIDRQIFLQSKGYMLRPRFRPGWVPSWHTNGKDAMKCEDSYCLSMNKHVVDARRISDDKLVHIKRVKTGDVESSIALMLSSEQLRQDSRNHCVPILDLFADSDDPQISYMIMPFLRYCDWPDFADVVEVVDFVDQVLEGLVFLHEQGVAHRDCAIGNIMMDATAMYPQGFHPILSIYLPDGVTPAIEVPRSQAGVRYYYIDYGISTYFPPGKPRGLVTGSDGRDQEVPELSDTVPYDPFAVDIFIIGNMLRHEFTKKFSNVEFLNNIIEQCICADPSRRPNASDLLRSWSAQRRKVTAVQKRWRLKPRDENIVGGVARDCVTMVKSVFSSAGSLWR